MSKLKIAIVALSVLTAGGFMTACNDGPRGTHTPIDANVANPSKGTPEAQEQQVVEISESLRIQVLLNEMKDSASLAASGCSESGQLAEGAQNTFNSQLTRVTDASKAKDEGFAVNLAGLTYNLEKAGEKDRYCQLGYVAKIANETLNAYIPSDDSDSTKDQKDRRKEIALAIHPFYTTAKSWVNVMEEGKTEVLKLMKNSMYLAKI